MSLRDERLDSSSGSRRAAVSQGESTRDRLAQLVRRFRGQRIALSGDLVVDRFVYGDIVRISREAPTLILEQRKVIAAPGGAGNAAANLRALGARPLTVGVVGRDAAGDELLAQLRELGCSTSGIVRSPAYITPTKSRILAGGVHTRRQQIVRLDQGATRGELTAALQQRLRRALVRRANQAQGTLIADYGYGSASPGLLAPLLRQLRSLPGPLALDSRSRVAEFPHCSACTPNLEELETACGQSALAGDEQIVRSARSLARRTDAGIVLATLGARGMCLVQRGRRARWIGACGSGEVADVTGAGDTVIAVFTLALTVGAAPIDAARLANCAAGVVVSKVGTATTSPDELIDSLSQISESADSC